MFLPRYVISEIEGLAEKLEAEGKKDEADELRDLLREARKALLLRDYTALRNVASRLRRFGARSAAQYLESVANEIEDEEIRRRSKETTNLVYA